MATAMDCIPPGSFVHGILQARTVEWVAISFSRESSLFRDQPVSPALQADSLLSKPSGKPIILFNPQQHHEQAAEAPNLTSASQ